RHAGRDGLREPSAGGPDPLVGRRERKAQVARIMHAVEVPGTAQDAEVGEPSDGTPRVAPPGAPREKSALAPVDAEAGRFECGTQQVAPTTVALLLLGHMSIVAE